MLGLASWPPMTLWLCTLWLKGVSAQISPLVHTWTWAEITVMLFQCSQTALKKVDCKLCWCISWKTYQCRTEKPQAKSCWSAESKWQFVFNYLYQFETGRPSESIRQPFKLHLPKSLIHVDYWTYTMSCCGEEWGTHEKCEISLQVVRNCIKLSKSIYIVIYSLYLHFFPLRKL